MEKSVERKKNRCSANSETLPIVYFPLTTTKYAGSNVIKQTKVMTQ